jgi:phage recombination protein Bet
MNEVTKQDSLSIELTHEKIGEKINVDPALVAVAHRTVAKDANATELMFFLNVAKNQGLDPFNKEMWCYKDYKGNLIIFAGRDGMLRKAQENPQFAGIRSVEVRVNDTFEADIPNATIYHKITEVSTKKRGDIVGAYCFVYRKDGEPTIEIADIETYDKSSPKFSSPWKTHKADMIKKVAEHKALKKAFGFSSVQNEDDFIIVNGVAYPAGSEQAKNQTAKNNYSDLKI